jgi:hypothetical protein
MTTEQKELRYWLTTLIQNGPKTTGELTNLLQTIRRNGKSCLPPVTDEMVVTELKLLKVEGRLAEPKPNKWERRESKQALFGRV